MPYLRIETNVELTEKENEFISELSKFTAEMVGKPEAYVMISVHDGLSMSFGGSADPAALVTLKSLGLQAGQCAAFSEKICEFLTEKLEVAGNRIYIEFADHDRSMFGWNGGTF